MAGNEVGASAREYPTSIPIHFHPFILQFPPFSETSPSGVTSPRVDVDKAGRWIEAETTGELARLAPFEQSVLDALRADTVESDVECGELKVLAGRCAADRLVIAGRAVGTQDGA